MARNNEYDYLIKLLALGDQDVGKTTFLCYFTEGKFEPGFTTTVGVDFRQKRRVYRNENKVNSILGNEQVLHLQLWDTAGQERFRSLCSIFFRDAMGFVLMFDLTNEESLLNCREWMNILSTHAYCERPDVILVGNKCDLPRRVSEEDAKDLARELNVPYIETSAMSGENVEESMTVLIDLVMDRIERSINDFNSANGDAPIVLTKDKNKPEDEGKFCSWC